jgi:hypothetical protein
MRCVFLDLANPARSCKKQRQLGARDARSGIFGRTGRRWMESPMVGVALRVGVAGSIQSGLVRRQKHHGVNECPSALQLSFRWPRSRAIPPAN